jgi:hypothetical protein
MYNWMARSQRLITWRRLALGTVTAVAAPAYVLGAHAALVIWATTLVVTAASIYYCKAIIGGVVGDYIGVRGGTGGAAACSGAAEQHQGCGPVAARLARMRCEEIPPHPHSTPPSTAPTPPPPRRHHLSHRDRHLPGARRQLGRAAGVRRLGATRDAGGRDGGAGRVVPPHCRLLLSPERPRRRPRGARAPSLNQGQKFDFTAGQQGPAPALRPCRFIARCRAAHPGKAAGPAGSLAWPSASSL